jgi:ethanolamine utilization protein EutN
MLLARVDGHAISTFKHASLRGMRLLVVQPLNSLTPDPVIALDALGAGEGQLVMISSDGKGTRNLVKDETSPARWSVVGIVDNVEETSRAMGVGES